MQTHGGAEAEEAVTAGSRVLRVSMMVDWNKNGGYDHPLSDLSEYVDNVSTDRALKGSAPEELFLIEGSAAAEMTFDLGGTYMGLAMFQVFNLFTGLSPFYLKNLSGCEVKYSIGIDTSIGTIWYPQFVGQISSFDVSPADATVTFRALDRVELLRRPANLMAWSVPSKTSDGNVNNLRAEAQSVIDSLLRTCDVSPTQYAPPTKAQLGLSSTSTEGCRLWITGNGTPVQAIGTSDNPSYVLTLSDSSFPYINIVDPNNNLDPSDTSQALRGTGVSSPVRQMFKGILGNETGMSTSVGVHYLSFTQHLTGDASDPVFTLSESAQCNLFVGGRSIQLWSGAGKMRVQLESGAYTSYVNVPVGPTSVRVSIIWDNSSLTGNRIFLKVGVNDLGGFQTMGSPLADGTSIAGQYQQTGRFHVSDIGYTYLNVYGPDTTLTASASMAPYGAALDRSKNRLTHHPDTKAEVWDVIQDVAAAEMGSVFWDENGIFRFWNFERVNSLKSYPVKTSSADEASNLPTSWSLDSVRNVLEVKWNSSRMANDFVYKSSDPDEFMLSPLQTKSFLISDRNYKCLAPSRYATITPSALNPWVDTAVNSAYVVQWSTTGNDGSFSEIYPPTEDVQMKIGCDNQARTWLTIQNPTTKYVRFAKNTDEPALRIAGMKDTSIQSYTDVRANDSSIELYGVRTLSIGGPWTQDEYDYNNLSTTILDRTSRVIPRTDAITMVGDPRIQLGDAIDFQGRANSIRAQIYGIRRDFSHDSGLTDTLTVECSPPDSLGIWGDPAFGRWEQSFIWGPGSQGRWDNTTTGRWDNTMKWYL